MENLKEIPTYEDLLEALESATNIFDEMDAITWDEDSGWQGSSYAETQDHINDVIERAKSRPAHAKAQKEQGEHNYDDLWRDFEQFLEPHTCDLIIKPHYARNANLIQDWFKRKFLTKGPERK